eukprot:1638468-Amphidinium_carterae.1
MWQQSQEDTVSPSAEVTCNLVWRDERFVEHRLHTHIPLLFVRGELRCNALGRGGPRDHKSLNSAGGLQDSDLTSAQHGVSNFTQTCHRQEPTR